MAPQRECCSHLQDELEELHERHRSTLRALRKLTHRVEQLEDEARVSTRKMEAYEKDIRKLQLLQRRSWDGAEEVSPAIGDEGEVVVRKIVGERASGREERGVVDIRDVERVERDAGDERIECGAAGANDETCLRRQNSRPRASIAQSKDLCASKIPTLTEVRSAEYVRAPSKKENDGVNDLMAGTKGICDTRKPASVPNTRMPSNRGSSEHDYRENADTAAKKATERALRNPKVLIGEKDSFKKRCGDDERDKSTMNVDEGALLKERSVPVPDDNEESVSSAAAVATNRTCGSPNPKSALIPCGSALPRMQTQARARSIVERGTTDHDVSNDDKMRNKNFMGKGKTPRELKGKLVHRVNRITMESVRKKRRREPNAKEPACAKCKAALRQQRLYGDRLERAIERGCIWRMHAHETPSDVDSLFHVSFDNSP